LLSRTKRQTSDKLNKRGRQRTLLTAHTSKQKKEKTMAKKNWKTESSEDKMKTAITKVITAFEEGKAAKAIAHTLLPVADIPSAKWTGLANRLIVWAYTTAEGKSSDARTFVQWKEVGRYPKKGTGFSLFRPKIGKRKDDQGEEVTFVHGFSSFTVFSYSDTEGDKIELPDVKPLEEIPLMDVAKKWGVSVAYDSLQGGWGGYSPSRNSITLCTPDEAVFFHELAHVAHGKVLADRNDKLVGGQDSNQEIVAELTASVLCELVGKEPPKHDYALKYVEHYASRSGKTAVDACRSLISDVEKTLKKILQ